MPDGTCRFSRTCFRQREGGGEGAYAAHAVRGGVTVKGDRHVASASTRFGTERCDAGRLKMTYTACSPPPTMSVKSVHGSPPPSIRPTAGLAPADKHRRTPRQSPELVAPRPRSTPLGKKPASGSPTCGEFGF